MVSKERTGEGSEKIDLEKVAQLVDALERDLAKVQSGSRDVQLLRDEVETLKNVLNSPIRRHHSGHRRRRRPEGGPIYRRDRKNPGDVSLDGAPGILRRWVASFDLDQPCCGFRLLR